jgi:Predicted nucleotide-binding protein containing TIR-like domain
MGVSSGPRQPSKPRVFVGSSSEFEDHAVAMKKILEDNDTLSVTYWKDLTWAGSQTIFDVLTEAAAEKQFDFAVFVLSPDDVQTMRGESASVPRANVIFEIGLFTGALGRDRVFLIAPGKQELKLPSDMGGIRHGTWVNGEPNIESAVRSTASTFRSTIEKLWADKAMNPSGAGAGPADTRTADPEAAAEVWRLAYQAGALEPLDILHVKIGDPIIHGNWGPGTVTEVHPSSGASRYLTIVFPTGSAMLLSGNVSRQKFRQQY